MPKSRKRQSNVAKTRRHLRGGGRKSRRRIRKPVRTRRSFPSVREMVEERDDIFRGGDLISVLPPKFFQDAESEMKHGEMKYHAPFYRSVKCVEGMCSSNKLTQACLNSLGIAMLEHQSSPKDYKGVLRLYAELTPDEREEVIDLNLLSLRNYMSDIFANYDKSVGLMPERSHELRAMLKVLNPFYYQYILKTDMLSDDISDEVYKAMQDVRKLSTPDDMVTLFLNYYNTLNPYQQPKEVSSYLQVLHGFSTLTPDQRKTFMSKYMASHFRISRISPANYSEHRYNPNKVWDMEGSLQPVSVPLVATSDVVRLATTISETYGDSFSRPNLLILETSQGKVDVDYTEGGRKLGQEENVLFGYAYDKQVEFMQLLLGMDKDEALAFCKDVVPSDKFYKDRESKKEYDESRSQTYTLDNAQKELGDSPKKILLGKVYNGVIGTSIYYRFQDQFGFGDIGIVNGTDPRKNKSGTNGGFGVLADFVTKGNDDCNMLYLNNIHMGQTNEISVGAANAILLFLGTNAPDYLGQFPDLFKEARPKGRGKEDMCRIVNGDVQNYRKINLKTNSARVVNIYKAEMVMTTMDDPRFKLATMVEVSDYDNVDNTDNALVMRTKFLIVWAEKTGDVRTAFKESCRALDGMLMMHVWDDLVAQGEVGGVSDNLPPSDEEEIAGEAENAVESGIVAGVEEGVEEAAKKAEEKVATEVGNAVGDALGDVLVDGVEEKENEDAKKSAEDGFIPLPPVPKPPASKGVLRPDREIKPASKTRRLARQLAPNRTRKIRIDESKNTLNESPGTRATL